MNEPKVVEEKITVRGALPDDACEIANVHLNSWREAYKGLLPQDYLDQLPLTFRRRFRFWKSVIANSETKERTFAAESEKAGIVGFIAVTPERDEEFKTWGEIGAVYLFQSYQKKGIGLQLIEEAFRYLRAEGFQKAYCWVLENNPTCGFYERAGGYRLENQVKPTEIGGKKVREFAYSWDLGDR